MAEKYVCTLSEQTQKKAKKELNEDPKERDGALQTFREWIEREQWISAPTDPLFLLAFLRVGKYSQLKARERLGNFISALNNQVKGIVGHDPADPKSLQIIRDGIYVFLPGTDKEGRRIVLFRMNAINMSSYSWNDFLLANVPLFHSLMFFDEDEQVNGIQFLADYGGAKMSHLSWIGFDNMKKLAEFTNKAFPARIGSINYYNTGPVFEAAMEAFRPFLSKKLKERVKVHHTMVSVYDMIEKCHLPTEYLPDDYTGPSAGSIPDIMEQNIKELLLDPVRREFLKTFYSGNYKADLTKKPTETEATASFRKLNVS